MALARRFAPLLLAAALVAALLPLAATGTASAASGGGLPTVSVSADGCPVPIPLAKVRTGSRGVGLTVLSGTKPRPFRVEVLGVLHDGLGAGRHLILVDVSDLPGSRVIGDRGIWAGMSGSPVYIGGKFLGAIGYGFSAAGNIGGVTPAADMLKLLSPAAAAQTKAAPERVSLTSTMRSRLTGSSRSGAAMERLPMPLAVSGLNYRRLAQFRSQASSADAGVIPYAAGSGSGAARVKAAHKVAPLKPGGNFAATLSYGDITASAVGTTSVVCRGQALSFAHPFTHAGRVSFGAHHAQALAVVTDATRGSFKMASLGAPVGTVDQDRGAAIRTKLGPAPATIPVRSTITTVEDKRKRVGGVRVVESGYLPALAYYGLQSGFDAAIDRAGGGSTKVTWTISGTRRNGAPFTVRRSDRFADISDVASDPSYDLAITLDALLNNPYENVRVTAVDFTASVRESVRRLRVVSTSVSVNGGAFRNVGQLKVRPGDSLRVRTTLQPYQSAKKVVVLSALKVPAGTSGAFGTLGIAGGGLAGGDGSSADCLFQEGGCTGKEGMTSVKQLLADITSRPGNDALEVALRFDEGTVPKNTPAVTYVATSLTQVVSGSRDIAIEVR